MTTTPAPNDLDLDEMAKLAAPITDGTTWKVEYHETQQAWVIRSGPECVAECFDKEEALALVGIRNNWPALLDELAQTRIDRDERLTLKESSNLAKMVDAAREELAKTRAELAGRAAWLYRNSTRMTQMRYDAATAAGYDFAQYTAVMEQPVDRDALIAYLREEIAFAEREIAAIDANPATTAEPADEPKATRCPVLHEDGVTRCHDDAGHAGDEHGGTGPHGHKTWTVS